MPCFFEIHLNLCRNLCRNLDPLQVKSISLFSCTAYRYISRPHTPQQAERAMLPFLSMCMTCIHKWPALSVILNTNQVPLSLDLQSKETYVSLEDAREGYIKLSECPHGAKRFATLQVCIAEQGWTQPALMLLYRGKRSRA